ncbi:MAG: MerR family DNA-binding transcriptional regulator [Gammaproteobacteria bacterium]
MSHRGPQPLVAGGGVEIEASRDMDGGLKIGELARRAGVTAKAIRFYERKRVLPPAKAGREPLPALR